MGWRLLGDKVAALAAENGATAIATDDRSEIATLGYYLRDDPLPRFIWSPNARPTNQFELKQPLTANSPAPILMISGCRGTARYSGGFDSVVALPDFSVKTGPTSSRGYSAFLLSGGHGPLAPLAPCKRR
jgi:hypothetical protein